MVKKVLLAAGGVLAMAVVVIIAQTMMLGAGQRTVAPVDPPAIDADRAAAHLSRAVQFKTISHLTPGLFDRETFRAFHGFLEEAYPNVHAALQRELISDLSLLYTWEGTDSALEPLLLLAHFDVVPISPGTEKDWSHDPFSGAIEDGYIWGRGTLDDKVSVIGILEAVEWLLEQGFTPERTVYLSFGHDEEVGGTWGAKVAADILAERGVRLAAVIDEGASIVDGLMPGVDKPVALIGIAEKGYLSLELSVEVPTGHSSMPPRDSAISILSQAIVRLRDNPFPGGLGGPSKQLFAAVAPEMPLMQRVMFANDWLFGRVIEKVLSDSPETNALMRTTMAPTIFEAGVKDNVLPGSARAAVNFRILPGEAGENVINRVRRIIKDDRVRIEMIGGLNEPSPVSPIDSEAYRTIEQTILELYPGVVVSPFLVVGGTDSRHFYGLTDNVYRFVPMWLTKEDIPRLHGTNERIGVENMADIVRYYVQTIRNFCS